MPTMTKGANLPVTATTLTAVVSWVPGPGIDVDASALLVTESGKVRNDDDFVFYNAPAHASGSVQYVGKSPGHDSLTVDLSRVEPAVERIVLAASADGCTFGQVQGLTLTITDTSSGGEIATFAMTAAEETSFVTGELYRRAGAWKFRAVAQGYTSGLAGLATDFGISIGDDEAASIIPPASIPPAAPTPPPAPAAGSFGVPSLPPRSPGHELDLDEPQAPRGPMLAPGPVPGQGPAPSYQAPPSYQPTPSYQAPAPAAAAAPGISLKKQQLVSMEKRVAATQPRLVSLVKQAGVSLEKRGLGEHTARVAICLDISGSMHALYRSGKIQRLVERILALGLRFDDDGEVDVFLFGTRGHQVQALGLGNVDGYTEAALHQHPLEPGTSYATAMTLIRQHYFGSTELRYAPYPQPLPVYVMFVTDGRTSDERSTVDQVIASSYEPMFWQFMAIGESNRALAAPAASGGGGGGGGLFRRAKAAAKPPKPSGEFAFLEALDDLGGRYVDNADFFSVADPEHIPDADLFDLLMSEYPGWVTLARTNGLLPPAQPQA